jgi:flagellar hook assembly protein FlgD
VYQTKNEIVIDSPIKVTGVNIYDASGKLLYTKKQNENKVKINSVFFKSGVYLVEVETSQGKQTKKVLK